MKKDVKKLCLMGIALIALLAAVMVIIYLDKNKQSEEDTADTNTNDEVDLTFTSYTAEDIKGLTITNSGGTFTILGTDDYVDNVRQYTIERLDKVPLDNTDMNKAVNYIAETVADYLVEEDAEDLDKYGLEKPVCQIDVLLNDGSIDSIIVGIESPEYLTRYARKADSRDVYIIPSYKVDYSLKPEYSHIQKMILPEYNTEEIVPINKITIVPKDEEPITIEQLPVDDSGAPIKGFNTHQFIKPINIPIDTQNGEKLIYGMHGLIAIETVWYEGDNGNYSDFGLDEPSYVIEMQMVRDNYTLNIGDPVMELVENDDGTQSNNLKGYYGTFSEMPGVVYVFSPESLPWIDINYEAVMAKNFLLLNIISISDVIIEVGDYYFHIESEGDYESGTSFKLNGEEVPESDSLRSLYQYIISAGAEKLYTEEATAPLAIRYTYKYRDAALSDDIVEFYPADDRTLIIYVNGEPLYKCRENYLFRLNQNIEAYLNGESLLMSW